MKKIEMNLLNVNTGDTYDMVREKMKGSGNTIFGLIPIIPTRNEEWFPTQSSAHKFLKKVKKET